MEQEAKTWSFVMHTDPKRAQRLVDVADWPAIFDPPPAVLVRDEESQKQKRIEILISGTHPRAEYESALAAVLKEQGLGTPIIKLKEAAEKDWVAESQRGLKPVYAGRFVIHGEHNRNIVNPNQIGVLIEAGQAFGTGHHQSTQGALVAIDGLGRKVTPMAILDLGTGSGVLAIAMAKFWLAPVLATDVDPVAVAVTNENIDKNMIPRRHLGEHTPGVCAITANGLDDPAFGLEGPFDIVTANILARPLIDLAPALAKHVRPGGYVILSGFLEGEEADVFGAYRPLAFRLERAIPLGEWRTLILQKA